MQPRAFRVDFQRSSFISRRTCGKVIGWIIYENPTYCDPDNFVLHFKTVAMFFRPGCFYTTVGNIFATWLIIIFHKYWTNDYMNQWA